MNRRVKRFILVVGVLLVWALGLLPAAAFAERVPTKVDIVNERNKPISKLTVAAGERFELHAQVDMGAEDDYLEWKITSGKKVVQFVDYEKYGDEPELRALKAGTAKVQVYVNDGTSQKIMDTITIKVKKSSAGGQIFAKGSKTKYEEVRDDFDLEVTTSKPSIKESQLQWSISDPGIADFAYGRKTGREVEFYAKKTGTTNITCRYVVNGKTKSSVTFTVKVVWDD